MSRSIQVKCDVCGKQKQETNGWFVIEVNPIPNGRSILEIFHGDDHTKGGSIDLCGESCVNKKVSELIGAKGV